MFVQRETRLATKLIISVINMDIFGRPILVSQRSCKKPGKNPNQIRCIGHSFILTPQKKRMQYSSYSC